MFLRNISCLFGLPPEIRKQVIWHYLNKIAGIRSNAAQKTSKNLLKLAQRLPALTVNEFSAAQLVLQLHKSPAISARARPYPSSDLATLKEVWGNQEYSPCLNLLKELKVTNPLIVDAGSNAGYAALYFAAHLPQLRLICIEPDTENFNLLKANLANNHITNAVLIQGALYPKNCRLELREDYRGGTHASYYVAENPQGPIQAFTFEEITAGHQLPVDLLKIDVEGAEHPLFEDTAMASSILGKVRAIAIEIHDDKASRKNILANLADNGFTVFTRAETTFGIKR